MLERLQKIIARAGVASRREAETLITDGKVTVNGEMVTELGAKADSAKDHIKVNGKLIQPDEARQYILLYKPKGFVSTVHDPEGRPTVTDLINDVPARIYPIGRLDFNTEGVLLLTNDGDLTHKLLAPKSKCPKTYTVKVHGNPDPKTLARLQRGMTIDGNRYGSCQIEMLKSGQNSWLRVVLFEGKNHQIKKMFETVGHPVSKLRRIAFAFLTSKGLRPGEWRYLSSVEVSRLNRGDYEFLTPLNPFKFLREVGVGLRLSDYEAYRETHGGPAPTRSKDPKRAQYVKKMRDREQQGGRFERDRPSRDDRDSSRSYQDRDENRGGSSSRRPREGDGEARPRRGDNRQGRPRGDRDQDRGYQSRDGYGKREDSRGRSRGSREDQRSGYRDGERDRGSRSNRDGGYRSEERRGGSDRNGPPRSREGDRDRRPRPNREGGYRSEERRGGSDRSGPPRGREGDRDRRPRPNREGGYRSEERRGGSDRSGPPRGREGDRDRRPRPNRESGGYRSEERRGGSDRSGPSRGREGDRDRRPRPNREGGYRSEERRGGSDRSGPYRGREGERDRRPRSNREEGGYRSNDRRDRDEGEKRYSSRREGSAGRRPNSDRSDRGGSSQGKPARFKAKRPQKAWSKSFDRSGKKGDSKK